MKNNVCKDKTTGRAGLFLAAMLMTLTTALRAQDVQFQQVNLISDLPGVAASQDTNLVNSWGFTFSPTSPFWVSDNGTGMATLYAVTNDSSGVAHVVKQALQVTIPGNGTPTGIVNNSGAGFNGDAFLFVSEDGTVSGWRGALGTAAETLVPANPNNVYKGATLAPTANGTVLLAANFHQGTVDVYGTNSVLIGQFSDFRTPRGYAPFGIQSVDGVVFVTFAKQDAAKHDDVADRGNGLIDTFDPQSGRFHRFATGSNAGGSVEQMNSPWGMALAPKSFGKHSGDLLVGNFGSGSIMTFDCYGNFRGQLQGLNGERLTIDGLWALSVGNGVKAGVTNTIYFSAGPFGENHGMFGSLTPVPAPDDNGRDHGRDHHDRD